MKIKKVSSKFSKNGFNYTRVLEDSKYYVYEQQDNIDGRLVAYEIHKRIVRVNSGVVHGNKGELTEIRPYPYDWGLTGWTLKTWEAVLDKLSRLPH